MQVVNMHCNLNVFRYTVHKSSTPCDLIPSLLISLVLYLEPVGTYMCNPPTRG